MLRNQFPEEEEHELGIEKARKGALFPLGFPGQVYLIALCRQPHSEMVYFNLNNLFAASQQL